MVSRRNFILIAGSTAVIAAAGKQASQVGKMPPSAIEPWNNLSSTEPDVRKRVLSYAILAPNPHNLQPWIVDLKEDNQIDLYCDRTRLLPETDPFSRQILIGHGAFLELLNLAAGAEGYKAEIDYFPQGEFDENVDDRRVATIRLVSAPKQAVDPLFSQILQRRSNKAPYDLNRSLSSADRADLLAAGAASFCQTEIATEPADVLSLQGVVQSASEIEIRTPRLMQESVDVMRVGTHEVAQNPSGIDLLGPVIGWGKILGLVNKEKLADPASQAYQTGINLYRELATTTPAFAWMTTPDNRRTTQLQVGRTYARLNLTATALGISMHPMSQVLQEYAEMNSLQRATRSLLNIPEKSTVQMLVRLGYAEQPIPAPRRALSTFLRG